MATGETEAGAASDRVSDGSDGDRARRRAIAVVSAVAAANMAVIGSKQLGFVHHLPDPPIRGFHADRVTAAPEACIFGIPDAPLAVLSLAANIPIALAGGGTRAVEHPWLPLAAASKSLAEAGIAGWYFVQMPTREHAWCAYCIFGATMNATLALLTLPEARRALRRARPSVALGIAAAALLGVAMWALGKGRGAQPALAR